MPKTDGCRVLTGFDPIKFCNGDKKPWQLVCLDHWEQVPKPLQDEIWREYKSNKGGAAHLRAINEVYRLLSAPKPEEATS